MDEPAEVEPVAVRRPTTIRDVAERAGVSVATVSKALNGRQHVRSETRENVLKVADELNFAPNNLAQSLLRGRSGTVGLLTSDLVGRFSLPVMMGVEDAFGAGSISVFLCDARGDAIRERHHLRALLSRRIDGLVVVGASPDPRTSLGVELPVPVVYAYAPSDSAADISVVTDNVTAGQQAAQHLLECGRRSIAYVAGDRSYSAARDRVAGARMALQGAGQELVGGAALYGAWSEEWGRGATRSLLERHPDLDGIVCGSDQIARGCLDVLHDLGRTVPTDIAVIGHDNWEPVAAHARPPLTTIDMRLDTLGRRAAELLFQAIAGSPEPGIHSTTSRLVVRSSSI